MVDLIALSGWCHPGDLLILSASRPNTPVRSVATPVRYGVPVHSSFWMVGSIFAATAAWMLLGDGFDGRRILPGSTWRHYALIAALPAATALLLTFLFVPESPRFLAKAGVSNCRASTYFEYTVFIPGHNVRDFAFVD